MINISKLKKKSRGELVGGCHKYALYYNDATNIISVSNGKRTVGVNITKLGDSVFEEEGGNDSGEQGNKENENR